MQENSDLLNENDFLIEENSGFRWKHFFIFYGIAVLETIMLKLWIHNDTGHLGLQFASSVLFPICISVVMFATYKGTVIGLKRKALLIILLMLTYIITLALLELIAPSFSTIKKRDDIIIEVVAQTVYYLFEFLVCFAIEAVKSHFFRRRLIKPPVYS